MIALYFIPEGAVLLFTQLIFNVVILFVLFQLSELEQRVLEAEGRAEEAEDKVNSTRWTGAVSRTVGCLCLLLVWLDFFALLNRLLDNHSPLALSLSFSPPHGVCVCMCGFYWLFSVATASLHSDGHDGVFQLTMKILYTEKWYRIWIFWFF